MQTLNNEGFISIFQLWSLLHIGVGLTLFHLPHLSKTYVLNEIVYTLVLCKLLTWRCSVLRLIPISDSRIEYMDPFNHFFCCPYDCSDVICCHGFNAHSVDILSCIVKTRCYSLPDTVHIYHSYGIFSGNHGYLEFHFNIHYLIWFDMSVYFTRCHFHYTVWKTKWALLLSSNNHSYVTYIFPNVYAFILWFFFGLRWRLVSTKCLYYQLQLVS